MKFMIYLMAIVLVVGVWFGINIAKDKPLTSNPFEERDIRDKARDAAFDAAETLIEKGKDAVSEQVNR